jgi:dihydroorotate dehydrogenase electron transfer subunit
MTCGTGLCMGCVLPAVGNDGITRMVRACVEGPVFRGDLVRWDDVGTIPFDALGAPGWKPRPGAGSAAADGGAGHNAITEGRSHAG